MHIVSINYLVIYKLQTPSQSKSAKRKKFSEQQVQSTMSLIYSFDKERFKPLVAAFINADFNFNEISPELKKPMRIYIHDNIPLIWLGDGYHFIEGHFTREAINEFRKIHSNIKFTTLRDKNLMVTRWRLVKKYEDSKKSLTSFQNISVHFVIESFRPLLYEKPSPRQAADTKSIFRDSEIQSIVKSKRQDLIQTQIIQKHFFFNENACSLPSAKDIFASDRQFKPLKPQEALGPSFGDSLMMSDDTSEQQIKEENKALIKKISQQIVSKEVIRCCEMRNISIETLEQDREDFREIKYIMAGDIKKAQGEDVEMIDTSSSKPAFDLEQNYFDIKRLLIQERGEEEYYFLFNRKGKQMQDTLDDEITRHELSLTYEHFYQSQEQSRLEFQRQIQYKLQQAQEYKKKRNRRTTGYRLGIQASDIKERILRFMRTYNPSKGESILEERVEELTLEPARERAFSQDHNRNDHSELIETRTINSQHPKGFCLSQFNGPLSVFNDEDITESEHEEDGMDDPIAYEQKQKVRNLVSQVKPTFSLFKKYYEWFQQHEVTTKPKYDALQEAIRKATIERAEREAAAERERIEREEQTRQRELKKLEQERYRQEQYELDQQLRAERKALKLKMAEEEKIKKIEEEDAERQRKYEEERALEKKIYEQEQLELQKHIQMQQEREREEILKEEQAIQQEQERLRREQEEIQRQREEEQRAILEEKRLLAEEERQKVEEAKRKAFIEEKERLKREAEAILHREVLEKKQRDIELAAKEQAERILQEQQAEKARKDEERRRQEEALERDRQKAIAATQALAAEQDRQRRAAEDKRRREEQERVEQIAKIEEERKRHQEALAREAAEKKRQDELEKKRNEDMAIAAFQAAGSQSQQKISSEEDSDQIDEKSSVSSQENERTAAFQNYSQDEDEEEPILQAKTNGVYTPSPDQTQSAIVMIHQSPGSFVDQNAYTQNDQQLPTMTLNQVLGTQLVTHVNSNHSSQDKKSKKRKRVQNESDSSSQESSDRNSRSRSSSSSHSSEERSSESGSNSDKSSKSLSSEESGSDVDSSSSDDDNVSLILTLASMLKNKKKSKSKKNKKDKKSKSKSKKEAQIAQLLAQMTQKNKKKKKKHSSSSSKKHKSKHSSDKTKRKEERSSSKPTTAFTVDSTHHQNGYTHLNHIIKSSPSPQKSVSSPNGFKNSQFETTAGSNLEGPHSSSMMIKQVSPPPIRISPTVPLERAVTSFDSWKSQNDIKPNGFHHYNNSENVPLNGQHGNKQQQQAPWEVNKNKQGQSSNMDQSMMDDLMQLQILNGFERGQKRPRHN